MKRIVALLLAVMMVFALCACGGGDKGDYGKEESWGHGNGGVVCMA